MAASEEALRRELSHYCSVVYRRQLVSGTGGNLSVRLAGDRVLITPSAMSKRESAPDELIVVDRDGRKLNGPAELVASKEVSLHTAIYRARPDVHAISHLHPPYCILFAVRGRPIPLVTVTAEARLGATPVVAEAPSGSQELAELVRDAVVAHPRARVIVLERHGILAIGATLRETVDVADLAEDTARVAHHLSLATGPDTRRIWDVSVKDRPGMHVYPGDPVLEMARVRAIARGDVANVTHLALGAHTGTHVDAPAHFIDGAPTLEQIPLDRFVGEATVLDLRGLAAIDAKALACHEIRAGDIVLCKTDNSALWRCHGFQEGFTHLTHDAAEYLVERQVKTVGIDYLSIERFGSTTFEVHKTLLGREIPIIEGLDLSAVGSGPYFLFCLPLRLEGVDGAPARAVLVR
jgi:arylformamidase